MLTYKGYTAQIEFDDEADNFFGEVINTRDVINFQGTTAKELKQAFIDSIEDYFEFCAQRNEHPEKPFSGKLNLRLDPALHRQVSILAKRYHKSLNQWIIEAISHHLVEQTAI